MPLKKDHWEKELRKKRLTRMICCNTIFEGKYYMNITTKGQVTIPKEIREKFGLHEGVEVDFVEDKGTVRLIKKGGRSPFDKVYGILESQEKTDPLIEALPGR